MAEQGDAPPPPGCVPPTPLSLQGSHRLFHKDSHRELVSLLSSGLHALLPSTQSRLPPGQQPPAPRSGSGLELTAPKGEHGATPGPRGQSAWKWVCSGFAESVFSWGGAFSPPLLTPTGRCQAPCPLHQNEECVTRPQSQAQSPLLGATPHLVA